ncbi:MAG TPA: DUF2339 domain-containing protein [Clostridiales bacterium]|nr:DUF2339 domain-containing protein [Clostridiales bacterium]
MASSEERIAELERRVAYLESIVRGSGVEGQRMTPPGGEGSRMMPPPGMEGPRMMPPGMEGQRMIPPGMEGSRTMPPERPGFIPNGPANREPINREPINGGPINQGPIGVSQGRQEPRYPTGSRGNGHKDNEALVGKYVIGALAAVLIFIAAISFVSLVWHRMTPEIKLFIILSAGVALSVIGFLQIKKRKNPIAAIVLGTGAGLLFIGILSANLVFHIIGNNMSIFLAGIWAVFFIISSRYTNLFFTTVIAYIGSYITLLLGLVFMQGDGELWMLVLFVSGVSAVMIYTALKKRKEELLTAIILSFVSYMTILIRFSMDGIFGAEQLLGGMAAQIAVIVILYLLMNAFYKVVDGTNAVPIYLIVSAATTILTTLSIAYLNHNYLHLETITCYIIFFLINLGQLILNDVFYRRIERWLTRYYIAILVFTSLLINMKWYDVPTGIVLIGVLLIAGEKVFKQEEQSLVAGVIILLDSLFLLCIPSNHLICSVYGIAQLGLMGYLLWRCSSSKKYRQINVLKTIGVIVILANSFGIPSNIIGAINLSYISRYVDDAIGYIIVVISAIALLKTGYFKNWNQEQFKFFGRNDTLEEDKAMRVLLYLLSTGLYFYGLQKLAVVDGPLLRLVFTLAVIVVALMQSKVILSDNGQNKPLTGIWIVSKYLILTWTILWAFSDLNVISVAYSIAGLVIAIGSILAGFKFKAKSIRLYGLVLTIIMVVKFILVDLNERNSITRVLALIAGGGLCFVISLIYNKLSEKDRNGDLG